MNKKIASEIAIGIILIFSIIIGATFWLQNKKQDQESVISKNNQTDNQKNESEIQSCDELSQIDLEKIWDYEIRDKNDVNIVNELTEASTDATMYYDEKETYTGFSLGERINIPDCSSKTIIQISPDGQRIAFYSKMCTKKDIFICVGMDNKGILNYTAVCDDYINLDKAECPEKISKTIVETDNSVNAISKDSLLSMIKIKGEIECTIDNKMGNKSNFVTDGKRMKIERLIQVYDPPGQKINTRESSVIFLYDENWSYEWSNTGDLTHNSKSKLSEEEKNNLVSENLDQMVKSPNIVCNPVDLNNADFIPPNNIEFITEDSNSL